VKETPANHSALNVLILCAGYGTRLSPLTDLIPKPLAPVFDKTLLERQIDTVRSAFPQAQIMINTHHKSAMLGPLALRMGVNHVFEEPEILGTGGPLYRMHQEGFHSELLVINGDVLQDCDLANFVQRSRQSAQDFALWCTQNPRVNSLILENDSVIGVEKVYGPGSSINPDQAEKENLQARATFSGISWYSPEALARVDQADFSIVRFWRREAEAGRFPAAFQAEPGSLWVDIGSPLGYFLAHQELVKRQGVAKFQEMEMLAKSDSFVLKELRVCGEILLPSPEVESGVEFSGCLILPGAKISSGQYANRVFGPGFEWELG